MDDHADLSSFVCILPLILPDSTSLARLALARLAKQPKAASTPKSAAGKPLHKFYVDYSVPAGDNVFDPASFEKFLHDRIKVDGKPGQLGEAISLSREGEFGFSIWMSTGSVCGGIGVVEVFW